MIPRKHAFEIMAWANGAEIEVYLDGIWAETKSPSWSDLKQYRIKPKQSVVRWKCVYKSANGYWTETDYFYTDFEISEAKGYTKLEYTRTEFPE